MPTDHEYQVQKFGGTSLTNADRFIALKPLLKGKNEIIVVSATQGTTSALQAIIDATRDGTPYLSTLENIEKSHLELIQQLLPKEKNVEITTALQKDIAEIKDILQSIHLTHSCAKEIQEFVLGYGETWSARILTCYLSLFNKAIYLDASTVLVVYEKNGMTYVDWQKSQAALDAFLQNKTFDQIVVTGFIAATPAGRRTILGRNGSDYSAAIFAKLFKAKCLTIWTDVDGIFTADPNRVKSAFVIESLSYKEALELAYFGAKVLHPMTIGPVLDGNIPLYIKNSFNPKATGTHISASPERSLYLIKGLTSIENVSLINIEGTGMTGVSGIAARVFQILHQAGTSVILISQGSSEHSICFAVTNADTETAVKALNENLQFEIENQHIEGVHVDTDCVILSAVGEGMVGSVGISGKLCDSLARVSISIRAIAQGSSERNISVVLNKKDLNRGLQAVHSGFYLSRETISIGIIGPGHVGSTLLHQIQTTAEQLKSSYQVNLHVRGMMNSKKMLLDHEPIDLSTWKEQFAKAETPADWNAFADHLLSDDASHAVIIDCTASETIARHYVDFVKKGIHIITPNKQANASDLSYYKELKALVQQKHRHYLYEATVCAGLPVITTLQDLLKTGDEVVKIECVVSGTLSYIFNELANGRVFSEILMDAKERGYTEPDPREDLSGMDIARKLVGLAREIGYDVTLEQVKLHDLVPAELKKCSMAEFLAKIPAYDPQMKALVDKAKANNERLHYVGIIDKTGTVDIAIKSFPEEHPFGRLQGTDNMMIFHTRRYHEQPLVIQGPGAGAEVSAAGIFADLLRLVSFLS